MTSQVSGRRVGHRASYPDAIVIGLDTTAGLQTCRTLGRRGVRVVGIAADPRHPACRTNTCCRVVVSETSGAPLVDVLERLAGDEAGAVLFPCTDASVCTLAAATERLEVFRLVLPSADVIGALCDERRFVGLAREHGLPVPPTHVVVDLESARALAPALTFPCRVTLPVDAPGWGTGRVVARIDDEATWLDVATDLLTVHPELIVQERVAGGPPAQRYTCRCYVSPRGLPILTFVTRSLRHWPPHSGDTCLEEAITDPDVRGLALDTVSCVPFVGIATIEIERDPTSGADRITAVTVGRPTDRFPIAEAGGVELLYTMYRDAIDAPLPLDRRQQDRPVKWLHLGNDVRSAAHALRHRELTPSDWMRSLRGRRVHATLDVHDPGPTAGQLAVHLRHVLAARTSGRSEVGS